MSKWTARMAASVTAAALTALGGCSSAEEPKKTTTAPARSESPSGGSSSSGGTTQEQDSTEAACVKAGAKANDKGVGAFCDAKTRCAGGAFCTADFGAPLGAQFCTLICEQDSDCGTGARCFEETRGKGCVPVACLDEK